MKIIVFSLALTLAMASQKNKISTESSPVIVDDSVLNNVPLIEAEDLPKVKDPQSSNKNEQVSEKKDGAQPKKNEESQPFPQMKSDATQKWIPHEEVNLLIQKIVDVPQTKPKEET